MKKMSERFYTFDEVALQFNKGKGAGFKRKTTNEHIAWNEHTNNYRMYSFELGKSRPTTEEDENEMDWVKV